MGRFALVTWDRRCVEETTSLVNEDVKKGVEAVKAAVSPKCDVRLLRPRGITKATLLRLTVDVARCVWQWDVGADLLLK